MANDERPFEDHVTANVEQAARQTMDIVHGALGNYFSWLRKMQSASPLANTDLNKTLLKYAEQNVNAAFTFAQKLSQAKTLQEVMGIQTEFMQTQLNAFGEQAKDLGAAYTESAKSTKTMPSDKRAK